MFVSVLEPYAGEPPLRSVSRHDLPLGTAVVLVRADGRTDVVVHGPTEALKELTAAGHKLTVAAQTMVATFGPAGYLERLFFAGGPAVAVDGQEYRAPPRAAGRVTHTDPSRGRVTVQLEDNGALGAPELKELAGCVVTFNSPAGATAHTVAAAEVSGWEITLTLKDDLLVGQLRVGAVNGKTVVTPTRLVFAPSYAGTTALGKDFHRIGLVQRADQDRIELVAPPDEGAALVGQDLWLSSVGPGDRMEAPYVFQWPRDRR
jgi:hypothetical protein